MTTIDHLYIFVIWICYKLYWSIYVGQPNGGETNLPIWAGELSLRLKCTLSYKVDLVGQHSAVFRLEVPMKRSSVYLWSLLYIITISHNLVNTLFIPSRGFYGVHQNLVNIKNENLVYISKGI